jgi:hypothetical protein
MEVGKPPSSSALELRLPEGALQPTRFAGWINYGMKPALQELKIRAPGDAQGDLANEKKIDDKVDARGIADPLRCDLLPECYIAPGAIRELRRLLPLSQPGGGGSQLTGLKICIAASGLTGTPYIKERPHGPRLAQQRSGPSVKLFADAKTRSRQGTAHAGSLRGNIISAQSVQKRLYLRRLVWYTYAEPPARSEFVRRRQGAISNCTIYEAAKKLIF